MENSTSSLTCGSIRVYSGTACSRTRRSKAAWILIGFRIVLAVLAGALVESNALAGAAPVLTVYKQSSCECCDRWIDYLRQNGFRVHVRNVADVRPYRRNLGVPDAYRSCHTALIEDRRHVFEGHVPIHDMQRLLAEYPTGQTLSVPGMPYGSPGMAHDDGHRDRYEVLRIDAEHHVSLYATYVAAPGAAEGAASIALPTDLKSDHSMSYVAKAALHGLLAILLGAGIMGIAYIHGRHYDKALNRRRHLRKHRDRNEETTPGVDRGRLPPGDTVASGKARFKRDR